MVSRWDSHCAHAQQRIYVLDLVQHKLRRLTRSTGVSESAPDWSPDGQRLAYELTDRRGETDVFIMNADGSAKRNLSKHRGTVEGEPVWSADGQRIAFVSDRDPGGDAAIYIAPGDGSADAEKISIPADVILYQIDWSPPLDQPAH